MAGLTSLPNELLLPIFLSAPTIQAAGRFSSASRRLYTVWLANVNHITETLLKRDYAAYEDAFDLAITEARFSLSTALAPTLGSARPAPHLWLPRFLDNALLAETACCVWDKHIQSLPYGGYRRGLAPASIPALYYIHRRLLLGYYHASLQAEMRAKLEAMPTDTVRMLYEFSFVNNMVKDEWQFLTNTILVEVERRRNV